MAGLIDMIGIEALRRGSMRAGFSIFLFVFLAATVSAAVPVGSVVIYSDGSVEKFLGQDEGTFRWEDDRKRLFVRSNNPIVPLLEKTDFLSRRGYKQSVASGDPDAIQRLSSGTEVEFTVVRITYDGEKSTFSKRHWECVSLGKARQEVLGVQRDLDRYTCERFVIHRKMGNRRFREKREFSYSPDLGLVVDLRRETRKNTSTKRLVAIYPPNKTDYKSISHAVRKFRTSN